MQNLPPPVQLFQMMTGFIVSQAIYTAAKLELADHLAGGPRTVDQLASMTGADPDGLYRLLRALATVGIFAETEPQTFTLTPMAECLCSDSPGMQHAAALMLSRECYAPFAELLHSVQTGRPAYDHVFGSPVFDLLGSDPERGQIFDRAMTGIHGPETQPMIAAYDFSALGTLIDIGGGNASVLIEVLRACPQLRGLVFDLPAVVERTRATLNDSTVASRADVEGGSFFEAVPQAGAQDAYFLRHILHDWDDQQAVQILRNCRRAAAPGAKILIVESVLPPGNDPHPGKWLDIIMLAITGGRERTEEQYRRLIEAAELELTRIIPTASPVSIVEATVRTSA